MIVIVVLVLGAGGYFIMKQGSGYSPPQTTVATPTTQAPPATSPVSTGEVKSFTVTGTEFAFSPKTLTVNKGDTVKIVFTNDGKYPHNFMITELNVKGKTISPGESDTVTFTADKAGTFTYFCSIPTHKDKGMTGTITVQ